MKIVMDYGYMAVPALLIRGFSRRDRNRVGEDRNTCDIQQQLSHGSSDVRPSRNNR